MHQETGSESMQIETTDVRNPSIAVESPMTAASTFAKPAGSPRIIALDSLRGIAALIVVFHHLDNLLDEDGSNKFLGPIFHGSPLRILVDGRTAVMLFFILSGFALSISIGKNFNYWTYLLRRLCRLMIPCIAGILLAAMACYSVTPKPIPALGGWFNNLVWNEPLTWGLIARHILMTGTEADTSLVNVLWSLVVELRISLIFPILYFIARKNTRISAVAAVAMYFLFRYFVIKSDNYVPFFNHNWIEALENIGYYIPFFIAGIVARENIDAIRRFVGKLHWAVVILALLIAIRLEESGVDFQIGIGAFLIIVLCVASPFISNGLSVRPIEWLGKVSYSLYLVHLTLLAAVFHLFYGKVNSYLLSAIVAVGALVLAEVFYKLVESPSIQLGRRLTSKKKVTPAVAV
jgi:peptidoglycan/LPS O-acetylase OafA/YrhL